jgi:tripeptide aminopeptidase
VLDPAKMPELAGKEGHDIVTSSGDTLLGADDKAGVAEIMAAVAHLAAHPELPRPTLRIGFTPDEEIGRGALSFDVERFGAVCAYTMDGSTVGELQDETFTGSEAIITIHGIDVHPGFATGKLGQRRAARRAPTGRPPPDLSPEATSGRQGFIHPYEVSATAGRRSSARSCATSTTTCCEPHRAAAPTAEEVVGSEPRARLEVDVRRQYPNMRSHLEPFPRSWRPRSARSARGDRAAAHADPRRHRRLAAELDGPADAERLHRRPRVPLGARVGLGAGHGGSGGDDRPAGRGLVAALSAVT